MRHLSRLFVLLSIFSIAGFSKEIIFEPTMFMASYISKPQTNQITIKIKLQQASYSIKTPSFGINKNNISKNINSNKPSKETFYTNVVNIKDPFLVKDINYFYKMDYLPFKVISYKDGKATLQWDAKTVPPKLVALSITSPYSILYKSAVLRFSREYGVSLPLSNTSLAYNILKKAYQKGFRAKKPFVWVYVDQHIPQKVYVWEKGRYIFVSPANTGVMGTTTTGTYMVYLRYKKAAMKGYFPGTNQYYEDPDVPWINYFYRGEAIHGFPRRRYGYPQSAGCVELPIYKAKELYPILYKYAVVTLSHYDKQYLATHPYKPAPPPKFKVLNPIRLTLNGF